MNQQIYLQRCLQLAHQYRGLTAPNPMVGAVLVHEGRIIGEGAHRQYGQAHAEVNCLENVPERQRQLIPESTLYVNLEPCAHFGKTPPCADRIVKEGIKKVVICNTDPFEQVAGKGICILQQQGVEVQTGLLEQEGLWLNRRFFTFHREKRPYVVLKWAQTENGSFAPADRSRFQMSDAYSVRLSHGWRREEAAIIVGFTTALNDNPQLISRYGSGPQPLRIALDKDLRLPATHHLLSGEYPTWIVNRHKDATEGNLRFVRLPFEEQLLPALLERLHEAQKLSLIVEGGATLLQSFIASGLWDEARIFTTPALLQDGISAPVLTNAGRITDMSLEADRLGLWTNNNNPYRPSYSSSFPGL